MKQLLIVGGGFAGVWAAISAAREKALQHADVHIRLLNPDPFLVLRPRLYEKNPQALRVPLASTLDPIGVEWVEARMESVDASAQVVHAVSGSGEVLQLHYDQLVLATGSALKLPDIPGIERHAWNVDSYPAACDLDRHLRSLSGASGDAAAHTFVVLGAGFTGLELITELRSRIADHAGPAVAEAARLILIDHHAVPGSGLGEGPRPVIEAALCDARVEFLANTRIRRVDAEGVSLDDGTRLATRSVIVASGMQARTPPGLKVTTDSQRRIQTDAFLRVPHVPHVLVAGDLARAVLDDAGHLALMSCQHSITMGRFAGYNALRDLLGLPLRTYRQPFYVTCLDLGQSGAMFSTGWDRSVRATGAQGKSIKRAIIQAITPPRGSREQILAAADLDAGSEQALARMFPVAA